MLTLSGFETEINRTILERGRQYFAGGNVTELEEVGSHTWEARVKGSETYLVEISLDDSYAVTDHFCDCPFDGDVCKHVAAVLFMLRKTIDAQKKVPEKKAKKDVFESLLQTLSPGEFQDFIRTYAARNKSFRTEFELFFAGKDSRIDVEKKYTDILQKLIKKYSSGGYIEYRDAMSISREINKLIVTGNAYLSKNNFKDALALGKALLTSLLTTMDIADDSAGSIGDSLDKAVDFISLISESREAAVQIKEQLFHFLHTELDKDVWFDYDYGYSLFDVFCIVSAQLNKEDEFTDFINQQLQKTTDYQKSRKEYFQASLIRFLQQTGKTKEADVLVQKSMHITEVRQAEADKAINRKDFATAKKLFREGIRIAEENNSRSDILHWQQQLLQVAITESDVDTIRIYAKQFAFQQGFHITYYRQWKATYKPADWTEVIEEWIADAIRKITGIWNNMYTWRPAQPPLLDTLAPVYIEENMTDRLLALVQQRNDLSATLQYHDTLVKKYPEELLSIYLPALESYGMQANSRSQYADLVNRMKKIMIDIPAGKERILLLAQTFKNLYSSKPRRPAMIEELNRILH